MRRKGSLRDKRVCFCYDNCEVIAMRDIAKNIRSLRITKNMTQDELAEKLFVTRQTVSNYETGKSRPDVEMLARIAEVLETDVNTLIYGLQTPLQSSERKSLIIGAVLAVLAWVLFLILAPISQEYKGRTYDSGPTFVLYLWLRPMAGLFTGWTMAQLVGMAFKKKPLCGATARKICIGLLVVILLWIILTLWYCGAILLNNWLFANHIRGEWVEVEGINVASHAWSMLPPPAPEWLGWLGDRILFRMYPYWLYLLMLSGAGLWLTGFPWKKHNEKESC